MKNADYNRPKSSETFIASSTKTVDAEPVVIKINSISGPVIKIGL